MQKGGLLNRHRGNLHPPSFQDQHECVQVCCSADPKMAHGDARANVDTGLGIGEARRVHLARGFLHRNVPASVLFKQSTARPLFPVRANVAKPRGHLVGFRQGIANSDGNVQIDYRLGGIDRDRTHICEDGPFWLSTGYARRRWRLCNSQPVFTLVADPIGVMCLVKSMLPQPSEWAGFGAGRHFFTIV